MKKYCFRLLGIISRKRFLWSLVVLELLFVYAFHGLFSFSVEKIQELSGGLGIPDTELFYNFTQLQNFFNHYGEAGRTIYLKLQFVDMVYPLVYSFLLASLLFLLLKKTRIENFVFLPFMAAFFDYAENILLRINILAFPYMNKILVDFAAFSTLLKWILIFVSVLVIIVAFLRVSVNRLKDVKY